MHLIHLILAYLAQIKIIAVWKSKKIKMDYLGRYQLHQLHQIKSKSKQGQKLFEIQEKFTGLVLTGIVGIAYYLVTDSIWKAIFVRGIYQSDSMAQAAVNDFFCNHFLYEAHRTTVRKHLRQVMTNVI